MADLGARFSARMLASRNRLNIIRIQAATDLGDGPFWSAFEAEEDGRPIDSVISFRETEWQ